MSCASQGLDSVCSGASVERLQLQVEVAAVVSLVVRQEDQRNGALVEARNHLLVPEEAL